MKPAKLLNLPVNERMLLFVGRISADLKAWIHLLRAIAHMRETGIIPRCLITWQLWVEIQAPQEKILFGDRHVMQALCNELNFK